MSTQQKPNFLKCTAELSQQRSNRAKKTGFGGNTINRPIYTDEDIEENLKVFADVFEHGIYVGIFSKKTCSKNQFIADIYRNVDGEQKSYILSRVTLLNTPTANLCRFCGKLTAFNGKTFKKYCEECYITRPWMNLMVSEDDKIKRSKKISDAVKKYANSEEGKLAYKEKGKENSWKMVAFNKTPRGRQIIDENAARSSERMKKSILSGDFTPNITNSFTHWDAKIILESGEIKRFRSSWEACFWFSNRHLHYEKKRIPYVNSKNEQKIYIADFITELGDILYELKPKSFWLKDVPKMNSIINYCEENKIKFIWVNEFNILEYVDESIFEDENLLQLAKLKKGLRK